MSTIQVEIFKTNVQTKAGAEKIIACLLSYFPGYTINFDLDDCDRILRIETQNDNIKEQQIIQLLAAKGYTCSRLI